MEIEENKKSFGEYWAELTIEQREYFKGYIDRQLDQQSKELEKLKEQNLALSQERDEYALKWNNERKAKNKLKEELNQCHKDKSFYSEQWEKQSKRVKEFENGVKDLGLNNNDTTKFGDGFEEAIFEVKQLLTKTK